MENAELIQSLRSDAEWAHANEWETPITLGDHLDAAAAALEAADKRIAELKAAQRWISVKERLPDDVGSYLVYYHEWSNGDFLPKYDDYRIRVMRFLHNGEWRMPVCTDKRCEADTNREVTHWRKLPRPPQRTRRSLQ